MYRLKPIRRRKRPRLSRALLRGADVAFFVLFGLSLIAGGAKAIAGIPSLLAIVTPNGIAAAQASSPPPEPFAELVLNAPVEPSPFAPQVLFPVVTHDYPDWLMARVVPPEEKFTGTPKIAIVIDDLGADLASTDRAIRLPKVVGLSFLPYADATPWLSAEAQHAGHEILLHMPMQAEGDHNPGPFALTTGLPPDEIRRRLSDALARVPGAIGINNHMGSRVTADRATLIPIAEELAARHLFFFDSRTTPETQVVPVARAFGVVSAGRDVFLDDEQTADAVGAQLMELEARARAQGVAIAIGHPHAVTLAALSVWTAHAGAHGFELIPLSEAIRLKTERDARQSLAR